MDQKNKNKEYKMQNLQIQYKMLMSILYMICKSSHMISSQPCPKETLLVILIGVGGTGKSFLQQSCAITATTGKASYNIRGCTYNSFIDKTSRWF